MRGAPQSGFIALLLLAGCVSARMSDTESGRLFREGRWDAATQRLEKAYQAAGESHRDALLWLLDLGILHHAQGNYDLSNRYLLRAEKIAEIKDYTSLGDEALSLLTSENVREYSGDEYEKVLIPVYLAMNYALQDKTEDALVEARKVNRILRRLKEEGGRPYELNPFAYALSALLYESNADYSDAWLDAKEWARLHHGGAWGERRSTGEWLWRLAYRDRRRDELVQLEREFGISPARRAELTAEIARESRAGDATGELVVLYENGLAPLKRPHPIWYALPMLVRRRQYSDFARVIARPFTSTGSVETFSEQYQSVTERLYSIEDAAFQCLDHKYTALVAKRIAGAVTKAVVARQLERATNSPLVGLASRLFLFLSDQADLRSWQFLPRDLQWARLRLKPGEYALEVKPDGAGAAMSRRVVIRPGKKTWVNLRYLPTQEELVWPREDEVPYR